MKTCEYFEMKFYCWRGMTEIPTARGKFARFLQQFTPESWTRFDWLVTHSFKRWSVGVFVMATVLVCELNTFYLKHILWIPTEKNINLVRMLLHITGGTVATREVYQYLTDPNCKSLGPQAWLTVAVITTESLICIKFSTNMFPDPCPMSVIIFWIVFTTVFAATTWYLFWPWWPRRRLFTAQSSASAFKKHD